MKLSKEATISIIVALTVLLFISIYFFISPSLVSKEEQAKYLCIQLCLEALNRGENLESGPCLSDNNPKWNVAGWVCDVAHWPRTNVDDMPENQCNEWLKAIEENREIHFVEVTPNCEFIQAT